MPHHSIEHHVFMDQQTKVYRCGSIYPWTMTPSETVLREMAAYIAHTHFWKHQLVVVMPICIPHLVAPFAVWGPGWETRRDTEALRQDCPVPLEHIVRLHGILYPHAWN